MALVLEHVDVAGSFEDLSDVQLAFLRQELGDEDEAVDAVIAAVKPDMAAMSDGGFFLFPGLLPVHAVAYADARDEVYHRLERRDMVGEVDLFLRKCVGFFGRTWQPLENLVNVAHMLTLSSTTAEKLTTRRFMLKTGPEVVQGTWFPYWEQGETRVRGEREVKYRLARPFFGDFTGLPPPVEK